MSVNPRRSGRDMIRLSEWEKVVSWLARIEVAGGNGMKRGSGLRLSLNVDTVLAACASATVVSNLREDFSRIASRQPVSLLPPRPCLS